MTDDQTSTTAPTGVEESGPANLVKNGRFTEFSPHGFNSMASGGGNTWQGGNFVARYDNLVIPHWTVTSLPSSYASGWVLNVWEGTQADLTLDQGNALHMHGYAIGDFTAFASQDLDVETGATYVVSFKLGTNTSAGNAPDPSWPQMGVSVSVDNSQEYAYGDRSLFFRTGEPLAYTTQWKNEVAKYGRELAHWRDHSFTFTALEHRVTLMFYCQQRSHFGPLLADVRCHKQTAPFTVVPGGDAVTLTRGGAPGYPGVRVTANDGGTVPREKITITLPDGAGLRFGQDGSRYQLTVMRALDEQYHVYGRLSGNTLTFEDVDLQLNGLGSTATLFLPVLADAGARTGPTSLTFQVGDERSASTTIHVQ
ncbi:hypothetical protein ACFVIM_12610 [Streptomyces sp. NPDC057638]|uniref:hypothetical protein n=1 Tax=Streptomyces sp. NPDC057638 TaxID=3346190 RepID=UPI00368B036F